jgi:hypothetical protein
LLLQATEPLSPQQSGNYFARLTALLFMGLTAFMGFAAALLGPSYITLVLGDGDDSSQSLLGLLREIVLFDFIHFFTDGLEGLCYLVAGQHDFLHFIGITENYDYPTQ